MSTRGEVLELLRENARYSIDDIARQSGLDRTVVEETIQALEAEGVVRGYRAVVDWGQLDGEEELEPVRAMVELNVTLDRETRYEDIADRLVQFSEVQSLRLVSGDFDFALTVEADSMRDLSAFVSDKIATIPEITQTVTHYIMDSYKEQGIDFGDGHDDDRLSISP